MMISHCKMDLHRLNSSVGASVIITFILSVMLKRAFQKGKMNHVAHAYKSKSQEEGYGN